MKLDFRIDWGYQYLYSRRHYHPVYQWDGKLEFHGGKILETYQLDYPVIWYGPGHCAHETKLESPQWKSQTKRGLAGIRVVVEYNDEETGVFYLHTLSGDFSFSLEQILLEKRIVFPVGPKYLGCHIIVTQTNYLWFRPAPKPGQQVWEAADLMLPVHDWARMRTAWLAPGKNLEFEADIPPKAGEFAEDILHLVAMAAPEYTPGKEKQVNDNFPMTLFCDGKEVAHFYHYFRQHDMFMQMLEDVWVRFQATPGKHTLAIRNDNANYYLLISRLTLQQSNHNHLDLSLPPWALVDEPLIGRIFATHQDEVKIQWEGNSQSIVLQPGWNEFEFSLSVAGINIPVTVGNTKGSVPAVYDLPEESPKATVGYDMTVVPHNDEGFMDWLLDYTWRTRLGNMVVFRSFLYEKPTNTTYISPDPSLFARWGKFCKDHHITVEAATDFDDGVLVKAAGEALHSVGRHEWPGAVYAFDPQPEWESTDMKSAMEHYLKRLKIEIDRAHKVSKRAAFGDASGGHRYCYMAGVDFIRTETMVPIPSISALRQGPPLKSSKKGNGEYTLPFNTVTNPILKIILASIFSPCISPG